VQQTARLFLWVFLLSFSCLKRFSVFPASRYKSDVFKF
jgi:hypothetical protein